MKKRHAAILSTLWLIGCPDYGRTAIPNEAPTVEAGDDLEVVGGAAVILEPTAADPEGDALTLTWSQLAGVPVALETDPQTGIASFVAPEATTVLVFSAVAEDALGATSLPDTVRVTVRWDRPPVADAGGWVATENGTPLRLSGRGTDPDGDPILGWRWEVVSSPVGVDPEAVLTGADTRTPLFSPVVKGRYELELRVSDGVLESLPDLLVAEATNRPPTARIEVTPDPDDPAAYRLDGGGSTDPDGDDVTGFAWREVAAPAGGGITFSPDPTASAVSVTLAGRGLFVVGLVARDAADAPSEEAQVYLQLNHRPVAGVADASPLLDEGANLDLDATPSVDPDGDPLVYTWTRVAGSELFPATLTGARPVAATPSFLALAQADADSAAVYRLVVSDGDLDSEPLDVTVHVAPTDGNFVFASAGTAAADDPGCGTRAAPCRTLSAALGALDPDGDGNGDGRSVILASGSYQDAAQWFPTWPTGAHLLGGRDPQRFGRSTPSTLLYEKIMACGATGGYWALRFDAGPGRTLVEGIDLTYVSNCAGGWNGAVVRCEACDLHLRDARLQAAQSGMLTGGNVLWVRAGGRVEAERTSLDLSDACRDRNVGAWVASGTFSLREGQVHVVGGPGIYDHVNSVQAPILVEAEGTATLSRVVLTLEGPDVDALVDRKAAVLDRGGALAVDSSVLVNRIPGGQVAALHHVSGTAVVRHVTFQGAGESVGDGAAVWAEAPLTLVNSALQGFPLGLRLDTPASRASLVYGNALDGASGTVARCEGVDAGESDLDAAPGGACNASAETWAGNRAARCSLRDPAGGDFHLNTAVANPCLDGGLESTPAGALPELDLDGEARVQGVAPDVGADEAG